MNREKKVSCKKRLVRNPTRDNSKGVVIRNTNSLVPTIDLSDIESTEAPKPSQFPQKLKRTTFNIPDIGVSMNSLTLTPALKHNSKSDLHATDSKKSVVSVISSKLDAPRIHSSLAIGKKIDKLGKMNTCVSEKRSFDDKVLKQVNFPYEKKIYKDLLPLSSPTKCRHTVISSREPLLPKDREPVLENFIEVKPIQEYSYIPNVSIGDKKSRAYCNNLRLYKVLQLLEQ